MAKNYKETEIQDMLVLMSELNKKIVFFKLFQDGKKFETQPAPSHFLIITSLVKLPIKCYFSLEITIDKIELETLNKLETLVKAVDPIQNGSLEFTKKIDMSWFPNLTRIFCCFKRTAMLKLPSIDLLQDYFFRTLIVTTVGVGRKSGWSLDFTTGTIKTGGNSLNAIKVFCLTKMIIIIPQRQDYNALFDNYFDFILFNENILKVEVLDSDKKKIGYENSNFGIQLNRILLQRESEQMRQFIESNKKTGYNRSKLMIIGNGGAGKTSCCRALLGRPFEYRHISTIVADDEKNVCLMDTKDVNIDARWKEIKGGDGLFQRDFRELGHKIQEGATIKYDSSKGVGTEAADRREYRIKENISRVLRPTQKKRVKTNKGVGELIAKLNNNIPQKIEQKRIKFEEEVKGMKLVIWDFGGQRVFDTAHHFYFTNQGLTLLVFNMQAWVLEKQREIENMKKWLSSLLYYSRKSHVFVVGTRAECDEVQKVGFHAISAEVRVLLKEYSEVVIVKNSEHNLWIFPVENSLTKQKIQIYLSPLRRAIQAIIDKPLVGEAIWSREVSLAWLFFMHLVEEQGHNITSLRHLLEFGQEKGFVEEELKEMLMFFTDAGCIVSFKERIEKLGIPGDIMDDTVIRPKWLIKSLAGFLFNDIHEESVKNVEQLQGMKRWVDMHRTGILSCSLLENILLQMKSKPREIEFLKKICEIMLVMSQVEVKRLPGVKLRLMKEEKFWLLPSMNDNVCGKNEIDALKYSANAQVLMVTWEDAVPQGLFERFVCSFLSQCKARQGFKSVKLMQNIASVVFRDLKVSVERESREVFNVILESKEEEAADAVTDIVDNVLEDIKKLGLAVELEAEVELIEDFAKPEKKASIRKTNVKVVENKQPDNMKWDYDCFLSHSWGDYPDYETHQQVLKFGTMLKGDGFQVWLDADKLTTTVMDEIHRGIDGSSAFIAFITKKYLLGADLRDSNAGKEFNYATKNGINNIIPVLLDSDLVNPNDWKGNVGIHLGNALYIDFTTEENIRNNMGRLKERIKMLSTRTRIPRKY